MTYTFCRVGHVSITFYRKARYEALVGVACGEEIKLAEGLLEKTGLPGQTVPLIKNGCADTEFDIRALKRVL